MPYYPRKTTREQRFWAKTEPGENGCIIWTASRMPKGYGQFIGSLAHRWIFQQIHGVTLTRWEFVLHSCDNPPCVNPEHLRVGSAKENTADMYERGRWGRPRAPGERASKSKLTAAKVLEIRRRHASGDRTAVLADEFGVGHNAIRAIVRGHTWKHLPVAVIA